MNRWKYCYGRKLTKTRIIEIKISLPVSLDGEIDFKNIDDTVNNFYGLDSIKEHVNNDQMFEHKCGSSINTSQNCEKDQKTLFDF